MNLITISQIFVSIILVVLILLQGQSGETSGIFGGTGGGGGFYQKKRGLEKSLFIATIVLTFAFVLLGIGNLLQ